MQSYLKTAFLTHSSPPSSVNCLFASKPYLDVQFEPRLLPPGEDLEAVVEFRPRELVKYCEQAIFEINGLSRKVVTISGEGVPLKVHTVFI